MSMKLHVANLPDTVGSRDLKHLFETYGPVLSATKESDIARCGSAIGLVEMASDQDGALAIAALNGKPYRGSILEVGEATARQLTDANHTSMYESMNMLDDEPKQPSGN